ncbi:BRCA1-A complex subunit Abraxas 1-like isoform X2 [Zophobas morio]|uniref:BRCA1-A complex subunit Abraxas 1-like isoform X2 n=1 Tax=Zophobas morio TaxID=2755281 RepID=UPI0030831022
MTQSTSSATTEDYIDDNWSVSIAPLIASVNRTEENTKEGFLIGELKGLQEVPISDEVERPYTRCKTLEIKTFLKSLNHQPFYDRYGRVIPELVKNLLGNLLPVTVGWYRCRSFRGIRITQQENMIHRDLMSLVPLPKYFVFCIVNKPTENDSSFNFGGMFFQYNDSVFKTVPSKMAGAGPLDLTKRGSVGGIRCG